MLPTILTVGRLGLSVNTSLAIRYLGPNQTSIYRDSAQPDLCPTNQLTKMLLTSSLLLVSILTNKILGNVKYDYFYFCEAMNSIQYRSPNAYLLSINITACVVVGQCLLSLETMGVGIMHSLNRQCTGKILICKYNSL